MHQGIASLVDKTKPKVLNILLGDPLLRVSIMVKYIVVALKQGCVYVCVCVFVCVCVCVCSFKFSISFELFHTVYGPNQGLSNTVLFCFSLVA